MWGSNHTQPQATKLTQKKQKKKKKQKQKQREKKASIPYDVKASFSHT